MPAERPQDDDGMDERAPIQAVAALLVRIKRRIAPPGSWRERMARLIYAPLFRKVQVERVIAQTRPNARATVLVEARPPARSRLLVLKLDHIGDLVVALPALQRLRAGLPEAEISLVCGSWNRGLAEASELVDRVACVDALGVRGAPADSPEAQASFAAAMRELDGADGFDCAIDLRHDIDTRPLLMLAPARLRAGFQAPGAALDIALPDMEHVARPLHARTRLLLLAEAVLDQLGPSPDPAARMLRAPPDLGLPARYAVLAPGAGAPIRIWAPERMAAVGQALAARHGLTMVVVGSPGDRALAASVAAGLPAGSLDLSGKLPITDLPAVLAGAALMVGMDSGLTHLAAGLGVPSVCVLSGTPRREVWQVRGPLVATVTGMAACSPCHFTRPAQCPHGVACLEVIGVEDVLGACAQVLAGA